MTSTKALHRPIGSIVLVGVFLNQSQVIYGINMSVADIVLLCVATTMVVRGRRQLPLAAVVAFLALSATTIFTASFVTPEVFGVAASLEAIMGSWLKLVVLAAYFFVGFNLSGDEAGRLYSAFTITAIVVSLLAVGYWLFGRTVSPNVVLFGGRFRGFMNDPNYFSLLLVCALAWIARNPQIPGMYRCPAVLILGLGVIQSGSKTGAVALASYLLFLVVSHALRSASSVASLGRWFGSAASIVLVLALGWPQARAAIGSFIENSQNAKRISVVLTDPVSAVTGQGSGRDSAWETAARIWESSPILGIGIGPYADVAESISGESTIAHNTYFQVAVEWGSVWALAFVGLMVTILILSSQRLSGPTQQTARDTVLVLMIGSLAISLNNARILWLAVGYLIASLLCVRLVANSSISPGIDGGRSSQIGRQY